MNRYIMTDGVKSIDLPQFPNEAWHFYEGEPEEKEDFYAKVSAVYRAINLTASATANIPFALVKKSGRDFDISSEWENKVGFMPKPNELIRLWRMSLCMTNKAYGFMENSKADGKNLRYIVPTTITPIVDINGLQGFKRTIGNATQDYPLDKKCPIFWMWRMDHTTELLPAKATEFQAMMAAAGILYYSDSFIQAFFKRGGIKPTMLVLKGMTNKENIEKIESVWDKIIKGGYKYLGKIFQGVDAQGGLEAQTIGEGVDNLKDETLTNAKIADIAMSVGMPLSLLLSNSANYATAQVEYKSWYENALAPWCSFMAEEMTDKLFKPLNLRFEFRPEMTDPGQEDEVARASAYSTYVNAGIKPSIAAQVIGMELPQGIEFEALDQMQEEKQQQAVELMQEKQSSSDDEEKPDAVQKEKVKFVPNLDQLKEMDIWRKFAFRKFKKGESLDFPFDVKTLPSELADSIREKLVESSDETSIKRAFDFSNVKYDPDQPRVPEGNPEGGQWTNGKESNSNDENTISNGSIATTSQAIEIIKMQSYGFPPSEIYRNLSEQGIDFVYGYHISSVDSIEKIKSGGIKISYQEGRPDASYMFLDKLDANGVNADNLGQRGKYAVIRIKIPIKEAATLIDDGLYNGSFTFSYSAARYMGNIPADWIDNAEIFNINKSLSSSMLELADSEEAIKQAFDIDAVEPVETKSDYAILELADAINKACENVTITE